MQDQDHKTTTAEPLEETMVNVPKLSVSLSPALASASISSRPQENELPNVPNAALNNPLTTFHPFQKLPIELRHEIWELVDQVPPRLVVIPQQPHDYPAIARVCSESRTIIHRGYESFEDPENENAPAIWYHRHTH